MLKRPSFAAIPGTKGGMDERAEVLPVEDHPPPELTSCAVRTFCCVPWSATELPPPLPPPEGPPGCLLSLSTAADQPREMTRIAIPAITEAASGIVLAAF